MNRLVALTTVFVVSFAVPAAAQSVEEVIGSMMYRLVVIIVLGSLSFQVIFVRYCARVLGIERGFLKSFLAVMLGGIIGALFSFISIFSVLTVPPWVQTIVISGAGMAGGALGIKLVFGCRFPKALLIYLLALTANSAAVGLLLILVY